MKFWLFLILFSAFFYSCKEPLIKGEAQKPNILLILADDLTWKHVGAYGSEFVRTPNIDRLAKRGVLFENAFASTSSCSASRASILTGRNGWELEAGGVLWSYLPKKFSCYTEILEKNGFHVGFTGKGWAPGALLDRSKNPAGNCYNAIKADPLINNLLAEEVSPIDYSSNFQAFLDEGHGSPFCFWFGPYEPHRPYEEGFGYKINRDTSNMQLPKFLPNVPAVRKDFLDYVIEVEWLDSQVGKLISILENNGLMENTIIIFTSDNGLPFPRGKATCYDYGVKMPMIAVWEKTIKPNRTVSDFVSLTDIAPTFLDVTKIPISQEMSGKSLVPILLSSESGRIDSERNFAYSYRERHNWAYEDGRTTPQRSLRTDSFLLIWNIRPDLLPLGDADRSPSKAFFEENLENPQYYSLKNLIFNKRPKYELYAVKDDPYQMNNLAYNPKYQRRLALLKGTMTRYLIERKDPRIDNREYIMRDAPFFGALMTSKGTWDAISEENKIVKLRESYLDIAQYGVFEKTMALLKDSAVSLNGDIAY